MIKPKIILHGAGSRYLKYAFHAFGERFEIVAISDNNHSLVGTNKNGVPVISPSDISSIIFDFIFICISYTETSKIVVKQLVEKYEIDPKKIADNTWLLGDRLLSLLFVSNLLADEGVSGAIAKCGAYMSDYAIFMNLFFYDRKQFLYFPLKSEDLPMESMPFPDNCFIRNASFTTGSTVGDDKKFAFVSLGTELYEPTYDCLEYFYPRMSKGGVIFIHSYFDSTQIGVRKATDDFMKHHSITHFTKDEEILLAIVKS